MPNINGGYISFGGGTGSGGASSSGLQSLNSQTGPDINIYGESGIYVRTASNTIIIGLSGTSNGSVNKFATGFTAITSGLFAHNLGTRDVEVAVYDNRGPPHLILPDEVILDTLNALSVLFNAPTTGRIVILG